MSKKDDVPRYESAEPDESVLSRNAILDRYGLGSSPTELSADEREMQEWEEVQAAKLAAANEVQEALRSGTRLHPSKVPLSALAHNPYNPRMELPELEEKALSFQEKGQLQPLLVCTRSAFLAAHPGQEAALGEAVYVVIDGNRRLAAAHLAGLETLRIDVNDALAASATDLLEAALIANIQRVDVPPLEEAKALQELVAVHGSQGKVAKRLGKSRMWVSQRLALLGLTEELQQRVQTGELKVEPARQIGRLPKERQASEAEKVANAANPPRQRRRRRTEEGDESPTVNGVYTQTPSGGRSQAEELPAPETVNGVYTSTEEPPPAPETVNGVYTSTEEPPAGTEGGDSQPKRLPYDSPGFIVRHLHHKMTGPNFVTGARAWMVLLREQFPEEYSALLDQLNQEEQQTA
ncbi:ParB/RepB/Spo0J family partition protein [Streptomyces sp. NPDC058286]|uniref:ParB/RepB/Spo0J family partition protein n=1 Tax=Streptomyces sp. NPDC058286 TaxID=3346422 RepID=UPI0036E6DAE9